MSLCWRKHIFSSETPSVWWILRVSFQVHDWLEFPTSVFHLPVRLFWMSHKRMFYSPPLGSCWCLWLWLPKVWMLKSFLDPKLNCSRVHPAQQVEGDPSKVAGSRTLPWGPTWASTIRVRAPSHCGRQPPRWWVGACPTCPSVSACAWPSRFPRKLQMKHVSQRRVH